MKSVGVELAGSTTLIGYPRRVPSNTVLEKPCRRSRSRPIAATVRSLEGWTGSPATGVLNAWSGGNIGHGPTPSR